MRRQAELLREEGVVVNVGQAEENAEADAVISGMDQGGGRVSLVEYGWFARS